MPVTLRDGDEDSPLELAVDENLHRQDLDPVEEAHAFQAILGSGSMNKKQLAERVSKSASYVNDRLRLLDLPDQIQEHVASGTIPVRLAKQLIEMAKASEPVATACVQLVANGDVKVDDLEQRPERLIGSLGDYEWPDPQPIALGVSSYYQYPLDSLPLPAEGCDDIRERYANLGEEVGFRFDHDRRRCRPQLRLPARVQGRAPLVERFITDPAFIADRVRLKLDSYERELKRREREADRQQTRARLREVRRRREGAAAAGAPAAGRGQAGCDRRELRARSQAAAPLRRAEDHHSAREAARAADPRPRGGQARRTRPALRARGLADHRAEERSRQDGREGPLPGRRRGGRAAVRLDRAGPHPRADHRPAAAGADRRPRRRPGRRREQQRVYWQLPGQLRRRAEQRDPRRCSTGSLSRSCRATLAERDRTTQTSEAQAA